jgi:hypothetical protein
VHHSIRGKSFITSLLQLYSSHPIRLRTHLRLAFSFIISRLRVLAWHISGSGGQWLGGRNRSGVFCGLGFFTLYDGMAYHYRPLSPRFLLRSYPRCNRLRHVHAKHSGNFDSSYTSIGNFGPSTASAKHFLALSVVECWHIEPYQKHYTLTFSPMHCVIAFLTLLSLSWSLLFPMGGASTRWTRPWRSMNFLCRLRKSRRP